mmetsp:Transcript_20581/g.42405  ORF Transcript_20581/g.42405 Transcript_20581/m.42405 type:complete len:961 (+) Transcript_20581:126-3008(+)
MIRQLVLLQLFAILPLAGAATLGNSPVYPKQDRLPSHPSILEKLKRVDLSQRMNNRHRQDPIKVPLGTSIIDVLTTEKEKNESARPRNYPNRRAYTTSRTTSNTEHNEDGQKQDRWRRNKRLRQFEIEALIEGDDERIHDDKQASEINKTNGGTDEADISKLLVQEVESMAITSETTYKFNDHWAKHGKNHSNINEKNINRNMVDYLSILVSNNNPGGTEGRGLELTILSINRSTGKVRGFQRDQNSGALGNILQITNDGTHDNGSRENLLRVRRSLSKELHKNWKCEALHPQDDDNDNDDENDYIGLFSNLDEKGAHDVHELMDVRNKNVWVEGNLEQHSSKRSMDLKSPLWIEPKSYSFHVDIIIEIDKYFIEKQGGDIEEVIEYINFLVSAANVIFEHEVDAHLNIVRIEETDFYDNIETTREALRARRLQGIKTNSNTNGDTKKITLYHAMLGRYIGGGIAFIDTICDSKWGFGVTSDLSGTLRSIDDDVLYDFFIFSHELGHSLGSGHTFDAYDPPVDHCGICAEQPGDDLVIDGLPLKSSATLMSYCNFCAGGLPNVATTLGGVWTGVEPRGEISNWINHPAIVASKVSAEPRRVSNTVWNILASKGNCVEPPYRLNSVQGCNDDNDCNDINKCTVDTCESYQCVVSDVLSDCCGNGICEFGEMKTCEDCGPFVVRADSFCSKECFALDGFMFDVSLVEKAEKQIFITSIRFMYSTTIKTNATIDIFVTEEGSYTKHSQSEDGWNLIQTLSVSKNDDPDFIDVAFDPFIAVGAGSRRGFYLSASEDLILFGEGIYAIQDDFGVELFSSRAISGRFGNGIEGFSLNCEVYYLIDDAISSPTEGPISTPPQTSLAESTNGQVSLNTQIITTSNKELNLEYESKVIDPFPIEASSTATVTTASSSAKFNSDIHDISPIDEKLERLEASAPFESSARKLFGDNRIVLLAGYILTTLIT